ncbi:MAG TPA: methyltransferase domain-containing protein, partial [Puia sp.]|nr:methyltransferase domain-containing protein [Puia sp.]
MKSNSRDLQISKQNISYYNGIASQYNALMDKEDSNRLVRAWVQGKFKAIGRGKRVMDFGGGTGMDLPWLTGEGHKIFFCEPSIAMKRQAEQLNQASLKNNNLIFLHDNQTDYTLWPEHSPLPEKVDAVLANFAVINCIPDPASLFRSLATVINPKGHLFALLLDPRKQKNKISQLKNRLISLILNRPVS